MSALPSIDLDERLAEFVSRQVADGRFGSPADVVRASLDLLRERDEAVQTLRGALIEGEESGPSEPLDFDAFLQELRESFLDQENQGAS